MSTNKKHVRVGSRGSKLALVQTRNIIGKLSKLYLDTKFELIEISTTGDKNTSITLDKFEGEGVFVKELETALLKGWIDIAVHSLKDMPTESRGGLRLAAVSRREDARDALVSRSGKLDELPRGAKIGTGSPRRAAQIRARRPDLEICDLRGNIDTRLKRVSPPQGLDAVVLAAAALIRLGRKEVITEYLSFIPAVGQGALGIEIRADDEAMTELVAPLNNQLAWYEVTAERTFLKFLGGGCRAPIAAFGRVNEGRLLLRGLVAGAESGEILQAKIEGDYSDPEALGGQLAEKMFGLGAKRLVDEVRG